MPLATASVLALCMGCSGDKAVSDTHCDSLSCASDASADASANDAQPGNVSPVDASSSDARIDRDGGASSDAPDDTWDGASVVPGSAPDAITEGSVDARAEADAGEEDGASPPPSCDGGRCASCQIFDGQKFNVLAGASDPASVAAADIDGDGITDMLSSDKNSLHIALGRGDGSVAPASTIELPTGDGWYLSYDSIAVGDVNGDGKADAIVVTAGGTSLLLGKGAGAFEAAKALPIGRIPASVHLVDLDNDGHLDIISAGASASDGGTSFDVLLGDGHGNWTAAAASPGTCSYILGVADFDGDHLADIFGSTTSDLSGVFLKGNGNGTFATPTVITSTRAAGINSAGGTANAVVADLDGDGANDVVLGDGPRVLWGDGKGTFTVSALGTSSIEDSLAVGDMNGDGKLDVVFQGKVWNNTGLRSFTAGDDFFRVPLGAYVVANVAGRRSIFEADGLVFDASGHPTASNFAGPNPSSLQIDDIDGDGHLDALVANVADVGPHGEERTPASTMLLLGKGDGTFQPASKWTGTAVIPPAAQTVEGDFDGDGRLDTATAMRMESPFSVLTIEVTLHLEGNFTVVRRYWMPNVTALATADINEDHRRDLLVLTKEGVGVLLSVAQNACP